MVRTQTIISRSRRRTQALAEQLGATLEPGTVLALRGELGAGKTTFVQGLAKGLGVYDLSQVLSPTYTLVNEYPAKRLTLVHIDFYRLDSVAAARALGLEEQLARRDAVIAVEWADRLPEILPGDTVWIELTWEGERARRLAITGRCGEL